MIDGTLRNIFVISVMCSGVALLIFIIRKFFGKNSGAWWRSVIWLFLLMRLCVPVSFQSPIGVMNNFVSMEDENEAQNIKSNYTVAQQAYTPVSPEGQSSTYEAEANHALAENGSTTPDGFDWLSLINYLYIAGLAISVALFLIRIFALNKRISKLKLCRDKNILNVLHQIKKQMGIKRKIPILIEASDNAPALSGMFFPNIIIPQSALNTTDVSELEYIFIHELTHYKRRDIIKLWLLELALCIHWFNPIIHRLKSVIVQDFELACDEKVLSSINNSEYEKYGNVLVNFSTKKKLKNPLVVTSNFVGKNGKNLRERLVMIKMFNKKKIIIYGIILALALSAVLVSCTSVINKNEATGENAVKVKYMDYYYTDIPEQYLDSFVSGFEKIEPVLKDEAFAEDMYGDFKYKMVIDSELYMLYRDKDEENYFYLVHDKGKEEPWEYSIFVSEEFNILLADIEEYVLEYGELIKYDKDSYEEVLALINGEMALEDITSSKNWTFYEGENHYFLRAMFPDENEYNVTLSSEKPFGKRYINYEYDHIVIYNADKDIYLENPTMESFLEFTEIQSQLPSDHIEEAEEGADYGHDINAGNGHIIETLMEIIDGERPIGDLTEEFSMQYDGGSYRMALFTSTDKYEIELIDGGAEAESMLDYTKSQLNIFNSTDEWMLNNPTSEQIKELMLDEYYEQREAWRLANAESRYDGDFIQVASPEGLANIQLDFETAEKLRAWLKDETNSDIIINDYKGTDKEFHMKGLEIFLEGMGYEYPVPLWVNAEGTKAIGFANEPIPVSEEVYDAIVAIAREQTGYEEGNIKEIYDLVSAELIVNDISQGVVTEAKDVGAIEAILTGSEIMNGLGGCPFGAKLILTRADGQVIEAVLPTDSCGYFVLGTATCYQYDRADSNDEREYVQEDLLKYFGMKDFSDANNDVNYQFSEQDIKSAEEVIEKYFKARLDKDAETYVSLMHPDRNITLEKVSDGSVVLWEHERITLIEIKPYDAQIQKKSYYHKDINDGNTIIFKVDFEVEFPDGNTNSPYNEGTYSDWAMILVREDINSEWYIYDQGY